MDEYIKREQAIKTIIEHPSKIAVFTAKAITAIENIPAADVVEVVHGHNKTSMHPVDEFWCSVCGFCCDGYTETKYDEDGDYTYSCECEFDYCPKCGAKMDGGFDETKINI